MIKSKNFVDPTPFHLPLHKTIDSSLPKRINTAESDLKLNKDTNVRRLFDEHRIEVVGGSNDQHDQLYRLMALVSELKKIEILKFNFQKKKKKKVWSCCSETSII